MERVYTVENKILFDYGFFFFKMVYTVVVLGSKEYNEKNEKIWNTWFKLWIVSGKAYLIKNL